MTQLSWSTCTYTPDRVHVARGAPSLAPKSLIFGGRWTLSSGMACAYLVCMFTNKAINKALAVVAVAVLIASGQGAQRPGRQLTPRPLASVEEVTA